MSKSRVVWWYRSNVECGSYLFRVVESRLGVSDWLYSSSTRRPFGAAFTAYKLFPPGWQEAIGRRSKLRHYNMGSQVCPCG
jgi:hypothetical protein